MEALMPALNQKGLFSASDNVWSLVIFAIGTSAAFADQMFFHLPMGADMLGLFLSVAIATIFVPGSGVSSSESLEKWFLTNATMALLGCVSGDVAMGVFGGQIGPFSAVIGVVVFVGVFVSYWRQGYQSRFHMMEAFEKNGWQARYEQFTLLMGALDSSRIRRPDLSHKMRQAVMNCEHEAILDPDDWRRLEDVVLNGTKGNQRIRLEKLLQKAKAELQADAQRMLEDESEEEEEVPRVSKVTHLDDRRGR